MPAWFRRLRARIRYRHFEHDLAEELDLHRAMKEDALRSEGVGDEEAPWRATRELGYQSRPFRDTLTDTLHWFAANGKPEILKK